MAADMTGEQMQAKITAARREAEGLKDKIRRRKEELGDTSRTISRAFSPLSFRDLHFEHFPCLDGSLSGEAMGGE